MGSGSPPSNSGADVVDVVDVVAVRSGGGAAELGDSFEIPRASTMDTEANSSFTFLPLMRIERGGTMARRRAGERADSSLAAAAKRPVTIRQRTCADRL